MSNQLPNTQTSSANKTTKNVKSVAVKPASHHVVDFDTRKDLNGKNDSGPDPEIAGREIPPQS